jgi:hypothetical protein
MKVLITFSLLVAAAAASPTLAEVLPSYIRASQVQIIRAWLDAHSQYSLAVDDDCRCADDMEELRQGDGGAWKPQPDFHPYYATGDFDGDGFDDAAIVVSPRGSGHPVSIVIFFGSKTGLTSDVSVVPRDGSNVADRGLFLARTDPHATHPRARLLFGAFGSEAEPVPIKRPTAAGVHKNGL